ncbi:MAG: hypothetical protein A3D92_14880 [Bacteroidetes bacterium RIFCSPHIGHO2_02_FULL_44_7]|nr:MAG: hypothetical protein A3D92_14880 [Bacteroidetes bacterium RIFCSPHIGHO2_02_FULL_44_7]
MGKWSFEESSGNAVDTSGYKTDGTVNTTGVERVPDCGIGLGGCFEFDGDNGYVEIPSIEVESVTVSVWAYNNEEWGENRREIVTGNSTYGTNLVLRGDERPQWGKGRAIWHWSSDTVGGWHALATEPLRSKSWYNLVGVYDKQEGVLRFYLNGAGVQTYIKNGSIMPGQGSPVSSDIKSESAETRIGRHPGFAGNYWNGYLDEVQIYKSALLSSQIQQLYAQGLIKRYLAYK